MVQRVSQLSAQTAAKRVAGLWQAFGLPRALISAVNARFVGAGDWSTANKTVHQSLLVALIFGLVAGALVNWLAEPAVALMGAE